MQIYDGSNTFGLDALGTLLWEKEFAAAHAGNAQINLVHNDGLDYIMNTDVYSIMGNYYFHYEVLYRRHIVSGSRCKSKGTVGKYARTSVYSGRLL